MGCGYRPLGATRVLSHPYLGKSGLAIPSVPERRFGRQAGSRDRCRSVLHDSVCWRWALSQKQRNGQRCSRLNHVCTSTGTV